MEKPTGRREAGKRARRAALTAAAHRLFAERGYEATTVRDIAMAAGLTERTFYRYFDGKEGLLAEEYQAWLGTLAQAVRDRPDTEPPLTAIYNAVIAIGWPTTAEQSGTRDAPVPLWLFHDRPFANLRHLAPRPLVRLETAIADAIVARLRAAGLDAGAGGEGTRPDQGQVFQAQVIARVAVAGMRSAVIRHRQLRRDGDPSPPTVKQLLGQAFMIISEQHGQARRSALHDT
jgi:AcrR family transcriptional regulator